MAKDSNGMNETVCTKCGRNPRAKGHDWCNQCKAESQKRYDQDRDDLIERRGFRAGAAAMKAALLASMLNAHPNGRLLVHEVTNFINSARSPQFQRSNAVGDGESAS